MKKQLGSREKSGCWAQENLLMKVINRTKSDNLFRKNKSKIKDYYSYMQQK
ncbi:hypothetical protein HMPREF0352_2699 [Enterococcus faecium TX1330]|nr:hypothetical protein HMPREF0352_2699 [Enterococcus faecium TX1330]